MKRTFLLGGCIASLLAAIMLFAGCQQEINVEPPERSYMPQVYTPDVPDGLEVSAADASLVVTWKAVTGATTYEVSYGTGETWTEPAAVVAAPAVTFTITDLANQTNYNVRVRAGNAGEGTEGETETLWSEWSTAVTGKPSNIPAPADVTVTPKDSGLNITWTAVPNANGYNVQYAQDSLSSETGDDAFGLEDPATIIAVTETSYELNNLVNNTVYRVRVQAVIGENNGGWSGTKRVIPAAIPAVPDVTVDFQTANRRAVITWDPVEGAANYLFAYDTTDHGPTGPEAVSELWTEHTDVRLVLTEFEFGSMYYVWVKAGNNTGWSDAVKKEFMTSTVYGAPEGNIVWNSAEETSGTSTGPNAAGYEIGGPDRDNELNFYIPVGAIDPDTGTTLTAPQYGGPIGEWLTQPKSNSAVPAGKDKTLLSPVVMAQWKPVEGATSYDVYVSTNANQNAMPSEPTANTTRTSYFYRDGVAGTIYYLWVQPLNDKGKGEIASTSVSVKTDQTIQTAPGAWNSTFVERADYPQEMKVAVTGEGEVTLQWKRSDRAAWYEVYYSDTKILLGTNEETYLAQNSNTSARIINEGPASIYISDTVNNHLGIDGLIPYSRVAVLQDTAIPVKKDGTAGNLYEIHKIYDCEITITGLDPAKNYWFWVRSLNHNGEANMARWPPARNPANVITTGLVPSLLTPTLNLQTPVIESVTASANSANVTVNWSFGGDPSLIDGFDVIYSKYPVLPPLTASTTISVNNGQATSYEFTTLDAISEYYIWVAAKKGSVRGTVSEAKKVNTGAKVDPEDLDTGVDKTALWGDPLQTMVTVNVDTYDPRIALGYKMTNGKRYFDVVVLDSAVLRVSDCSAETNPNHRCTEKGPHVHYSGNLQHVLTNRDKYIKPLQDAGIKVVLGIKGGGEPFAFHSLGEWPFEGIYPWYDAARDADGSPTRNPALDYGWWTEVGTGYPFDAAVRDAFIDHLAAEIAEYGLDGFDINDDDYSTDGGGLSVAFNAHSGDATQNAARDVIIAQNYAHFIYKMRVKLGAEAVISMMQRGGVTVLDAAGAEFDNGSGPAPVNPNIWDSVTMAGNYSAATAGTPWAGIPNPKYSAFGVAAVSSQPTNYTAYTNSNSANGGYYGWIRFYGLGTVRNSYITNNNSSLNRYAINLFGINGNVLYTTGDDPVTVYDTLDWNKW